MMRTDSENQEWWARKSKLEQTEVFEGLLQKLREGTYAHRFIASLQVDYNNRSLTVGQIAALRKYTD